MESIKFCKMTEYCEEIKKYFEAYNKNELDVRLYGDSKQELRKIMSDQENDDKMFFLYIEELIGAKTRVLKAHYDIPFFNWIGGEESFSKKHFIETMKLVWTDV